MKKVLKIALKTLIISIVVVVVVLIVFLIYSSVTFYKPEPVEKLAFTNNKNVPVINRTELSLLTWNIGYCGLGKDVDFFYEGGKMTRPREDQFQTYLNSVFNFISRNDSMDFILLQEVDFDSRRSYHINESELFNKALTKHSSTYAYNYKVKFVPLPIFNPMGFVESGVMTFSKFDITEASRYAYMASHSWPTKLFQLSRCFVMSRFKTESGKDLILINTHNSAFGNEESLRKFEMILLRSYMLSEYEKGNYVIAGGDWNQNPPKFDSVKYSYGYLKEKGVSQLEGDFFPATWKINFDKNIPTNRNVVKPFNMKETKTTTLDYFITSPNIETLDVKVFQNYFEDSDHQPVYLKIRLSENPELNLLKRSIDYINMLEDSISNISIKRGGKKATSNKKSKKTDLYYEDKIF
jgi:endonuclease/exonuclease/phosphatase family metal-dependent hydrolase